MLNYNFHSHTSRCGHALGTDEEYVKSAIDNGFQYMGFSDHAPFRDVHEPTTRMEKEDYASYKQSIDELKEKYKQDIQIFSGLECEFYEDHLDELEQYHQDLDYLLLGQHFNRPYGKTFFAVENDDDIREYGCLVTNGMKTGLFSIVAHPDVFMVAQPEWNLACQKVVDDICAAALDHNVKLEVNLSGTRYGKQRKGDVTSYPYPFLPFWQTVSDAGVECVYGLDAHHPNRYLITNLDEVKASLGDIQLNIKETL